MNTRKPVVLVSPLDWGFGHTTRCIPVIKKLLALECTVLVACNSKQRLLLWEDFPDITFIDLQGYDIIYGRSRLSTLISIVAQLPKILTRINREHSWLTGYLSANKVDLIISDNRYGLHSNNVKSVLITHQLGIRTGIGLGMNWFVQKCLYNYIKKFEQVWIPDFEDASKSAAGELSHPDTMPGTTTRYIGCLSRFNGSLTPAENIDLLVILSGPEPQRTILENIIIRELITYAGSVVLVRGISDGASLPAFKKVTILNSASSSILNSLIVSANIVVCRSGYTSVMDILKLRKRSILIPTPGQPEQEYLAAHLEKSKLAVTAKQQGFRLEKSIEKLNSASLHFLHNEMDEYENVVEEIIRTADNDHWTQSASADFGKSKK